MLQVLNLLLLLAMAPVRPVLTQPANTECSRYYRSPYFDRGYTYLYLKLEEALINDQKTLNELRAGFTSSEENMYVYLDNIQLKVVNGTYNDSCVYYDSHSRKTFCNSSSTDYMWELCIRNYYELDMTLSLQFYKPIQHRVRKNAITYSTISLFWIHASTTPAFVTFVLLNGDLLTLDEYGEIWGLTLRIDELSCNPSLELTKCVLSEIFSWVRCMTL